MLQAFKGDVDLLDQLHFQQFLELVVFARDPQDHLDIRLLHRVVGLLEVVFDFHDRVVG